MRLGLCGSLFLVIVSTRCVAAVAQEQAPCTMGSTANGGFGVNSIVGAPFLATARISFEQKLSDGNAIRGYARIHQARNTIGMTRTEGPQRCFKDVDGTSKLAYSIRIYDPEQKLFRDWSVYGEMVGWRDKVIHTSHYPESVAPEPSAENTLKQQRLTAAGQWSAGEYKSENLGTKTMFGVSVQGSRTTRTIPAGKEGNDLELVILDEHWWSQALGQDLLVIHDDPRTGRTTYELEELMLSEPDPSLFIAPAGYAIEPTRPV
jgi:hypothetical protein